MFIKKITLLNFRNFEGASTYKFRKLNLILGKVGSGKSTIGRIAIVFALYGHSEVPLSTLPTRGKAKKSAVEIVIEHKNKTITITREIPTKVTIQINGVDVFKESTNKEKDKWIINQFGDLNYFRKFRMIDMSHGINMLEEGPTSLRKTLVAFNENILNNIRVRLQEKKSLYDKFNKDRAVVYNHAPSEKRLNFLESSCKSIQKDRGSLFDTISKLRSAIYYHERTIKNNHNLIHENKKIESEVKADSKCPTCKQKIIKDTQTQILGNIQKEINNCYQEIEQYQEELKNLRKEFEEKSDYYGNLGTKLQKIQQYCTKLQTRIKQKDFKYTTKDVLIMTKAIKHLDKFYSEFILNNVKNLEPIINSVVSRLGFIVKFSLDTKANFTTSLLKDDFEFSYKDLSSGQKLTLTIAFQLALLLDKGEEGLIIADEGFNNLGEEDVVALYELFTGLPFQVVSVLHRFSMSNVAVNVINLREDKNDKEDKEFIQPERKKRKRRETETNRSDKTSKRKTTRPKTTVGIFDE